MNENKRTTVFIGHGRSLVWLQLKEFIEHHLNLETTEFNSVSPAGKTTTSRLEEMLATADLAFLIMTSEDEQENGKIYARLNVIHEAGLFQGRLGFNKAIILREEGCEEL
jgi:predicted nucleotide-binding protein